MEGGHAPHRGHHNGRFFAGREAVGPGFASDAIDGSILRTLLDKDPVILCSTTVLGHVRDHAIEFETGAGIFGPDPGSARSPR